MEPSFIPIQPPQGLRFYLGTWSGRLILINTLVFAAMSWYSGSLLLPDQETMLLFGAKDPVRLTHGEYWRFLTPIFVHIGLLHFTFNTLGLYYIGYQIEQTLGSFWFLLTYLAAGIVGNIASGVFSLAISAGASGALFGLLGCGYLIERIVNRRVEAMTGRRPRRGIYAGMVMVNVLFGFFIPGIDNAAHIGGLITGIAVTFVMINVRPNRLHLLNRRLGWLVALLVATSAVFGAHLATSTAFMVNRFETAADDSKNPGQMVYYLSQAIAMESDNTRLRLKRGTILLLGGERDDGYRDLAIAAADPRLRANLEQIVAELRSMGRLADAVRLAEILDRS